MKTTVFIDIIENNQKIQQVETVELKSIVKEFPYFQSARALYLKGLKNQNSFKYNNELKITAAHTTDRSVLFDFITSKDFENQLENSTEEIVEEKSTENLIEKETKPTIKSLFKFTEETENTAKAEEILEIGKPISFTNSENFSFNQWLQLSTKKPIKRETIEPEEISKKDIIIDKFIQNNPKIEPLVKDKSISISVAKNKQDSSLMTETLAKVYLEQKKYTNAIQAYKILSLKYPEKSGFFADQIKRIQILQKNKS